MFLLHRGLSRRELRRSWPDPGCPFLTIAEPGSSSPSASAACGGPEHQVFRRIARYVDSPGRYVHVITYRPGAWSFDDVKAQALANARRQIRQGSPADLRSGSADWDRVNVRIDGNPAAAERYALGGEDFVLVGVAASEEIYSVTAVGVALDQVELAHRDPSFLTPA